MSYDVGVVLVCTALPPLWPAAEAAALSGRCFVSSKFRGARKRGHISDVHGEHNISRRSTTPGGALPIHGSWNDERARTYIYRALILQPPGYNKPTMCVLQGQLRVRTTNCVTDSTVVCRVDATPA